jgi:lysophospholipase L1-like esterase
VLSFLKWPGNWTLPPLAHLIMTSPFLSLSAQRLVKSLITLLVSTFAALMVAEGLVRLLLPQPLTVPWADQVSGVLAPRPNVRGREFVPDTYDVTISFSSQRFRGQREYSAQPDAGAFRIAALGDSVTFGNGANDGQDYPSQLESILQERFARTSSSRKPEVINAGIGGTGTAEQALWYENWVRLFHPDLVVLNVFCNDVDGDLRSNLFSLGANETASPLTAGKILSSARKLRSLQKLIADLPGYGWLAQHSQSFNLVRTAIGGALDSSRRAVRTAPSSQAQPAGMDEQFRKKGLALMAGEMVWLEQRVKASGARLAVVFVPCRETVYPSDAPWAEEVRWKSVAMVERLQDMTSKQNIPFVDLTSSIRERSSRVREPLYYNGRLDTHPDPLGYRIIAELVAQFLLEKELMVSN